LLLGRAHHAQLGVVGVVARLPVLRVLHARLAQHRRGELGGVPLAELLEAERAVPQDLPRRCRASS
jgi:hypothetical protein